LSDNLEEKFKNFLKLFWLRPENAILCTFMSKAIDDFEFKSPSLDLACGDGLFTFYHLGGRLSDDYDFFTHTKSEKFTHQTYTDIFDSITDDFKLNITSKPEIQIDYGTDWKQALLDKSKALGLYKNLVLHDNNNTPLPFQDNFFMSIFSDAVYWTKKDRVDAILGELHRVLHPEGKAALELLTPSHLEFLDQISEILGPQAVEILDRKRRFTMHGRHSYQEYVELIKKNGFKILDVKNTYPNKLLLDIWNVGLRPIQHLLIQMVNSIPSDKRKRIKDEWVDIFFELGKPLLKLSENYNIEDQPYPTFILGK